MNENISVKIKRSSDDYLDIPLPSYSTTGSAGLDVRAAVEDEIKIEKGKIALVPTGFSVEIPDGFEIQVRPRSGLALKHGIGLLNSPGTIDSDYRGEVKIILINLGEEDYFIKRGERIAQLVISKVYKAQLIESDELQVTERNDGGFGHTGKE
jgi:dUTP pyrophosphatase